MKMRIVFKGGAVLDVDVTEFETAKSPLTGELGELTWKNASGAVSGLHWIRVEEIAAIIAVHEPDDTDSEIPGEIL